MIRIQFVIILIFFIGSHAAAQIASYPLNTNADDIIGNNDGVSTGGVTFGIDGGRSHAILDPGAFITLPTSLSDVAYDDSSFEFSLDFRLEDTSRADGSFFIFSASELPISISLNVLKIGPTELYSDFIFADGDAFYKGEFFTPGQDTGLENWRTFTAKFDLASRRYSASLGDILLQGALESDFDADAFKSLLQSNQIRLKGYKTGDGNSAVLIDNFEVYSPARLADAGTLNSAFLELAGDINGTISLTASQQEAHLNTIMGNLYFADYDAIKSALMTFTTTYETAFPPLYEDGVKKTFEQLTVFERVLQFSQDFIFQTQYVDGDLSHLAGLIFEHHKVAPGPVDPSAIPVSSAQVQVDLTYNKDKAAALSAQEFVVRPTGYYASPGDIVTVQVPSRMVNQGLSVVVGHHYRNLDYGEVLNYNRFPDISAEYQITGSSIQVASPFGGGIYIKVPEGTNIAESNITIKQAIKSPYFSWRDGKHTDVNDWLQQVVNTGAPWADFESDKKMLTVPVSELAGITNPDAIMTRWDEIMDEIALLAGRPTERPRAEYYTSDTRLVTAAFGAGYPMVIPISQGFRDPLEGWNPLTVVNVKPALILLHEMGHNQLHPTMDYGGNLDPCNNLEAEVIVHMLAVRVYSQLYGMTVDEALSASFLQFFDFYQSAFDWMITSNFRNGERMYEDPEAPLPDKNMLQYQTRSWAKYAEIAHLFGWDALADINGTFYKPGTLQSSTVCDRRSFVVGRDEFIIAACEALELNMTPLFHFWGINPSPDVMAAMQHYPKSQLIKNRILEYKANVAPQSLADYMVYHNQFPTDDYQFPRYQYYLANFNTTEFTDKINAQFDYLIQTYFTDLSDYTDIRSFSFSASVNETIIDTDNHTVTVDVAKGTNLSDLIATFTLSGGATMTYNGGAQTSGTSALNYNNPVSLLITAEDGTTSQLWTVSVRERVGINLAANNIQGPTIICQGAGNIDYSVAGDPAITNYNWSYTGSGVVINNNSTKNAQLVWSNNATSGTLRVEFFSACGSEGSRSLTIEMALGSNCQYYNCGAQQLQVTNDLLTDKGPIQVLRAMNEIDMQGQLKDYNLLYLKAGKAIELKQNMSVEAGASLIVLIETCQ